MESGYDMFMYLVLQNYDGHPATICAVLATDDFITLIEKTPAHSRQTRRYRVYHSTDWVGAYLDVGIGV